MYTKSHQIKKILDTYTQVQINAPVFLLIFVSLLSFNSYSLTRDEVNMLESLSAKKQSGQLLSVREFNQLNELIEKKDYETFKISWVKYLKNQKVQLDQNLQPYWIRKATEEYLISQNGLLAKIGNASQSNNYGFTFTRPVDELDNRTASFHRVKRSIFAEYDKVSGHQWLANFIHEVAHSLDSEMYESIKVFNNLDYMKKIDKLGQSDVPISQLNAQDRIELNQWLVAGLNRGLFGEYRAWLVLYYAYLEGRDKKILSPIQWLDELDQKIKNGESAEVELYRYLSKKWVDPNVGLFQYGFVQEALKSIRQEVELNPKLIQLGALGDLLKK